MPIESNLYEDKTKEIPKNDLEKNRAKSSKNIITNNKVFSKIFSIKTCFF